MTHDKSEKRRRRRTGGGGRGSSFRFFKCFLLTADDDEVSICHKAEADEGSASAVEKLPANKKGRRGFSATIKALLFQTSCQGKKSRKSKRSRDSDASSSFAGPSEVSDSTNGSNSMTDSSLFSSSLSSDSSQHSSLSSSSSRNLPTSGSVMSGQKQHIMKGRRSRSCSGIYALIVTLLALILWGKFCATTCTWTMLYATNHPTTGYPITNRASGCSVMDPIEYKNGVGLGGLLHRNVSGIISKPSE
ncbi:hypothetical protein SAY86_006033 [Trapa natans]|uniref:Uncharacterized protein n=1 Tax=Trapa natans TaxID=22666 RepID=A0AAN7QWE2_TRANT|nr:hypothetical protein SAY86_006033 [Trapa natans]